jgi:hypothetical protein
MSLVSQYLGKAVFVQKSATQTDGQLLEEYIHSRDEAAFGTLLRRHGPMVWGDSIQPSRGKVNQLVQCLCSPFFFREGFPMNLADEARLMLAAFARRNTLAGLPLWQLSALPLVRQLPSHHHKSEKTRIPIEAENRPIHPSAVQFIFEMDTRSNRSNYLIDPTSCSLFLPTLNQDKS